MKTRTIVYLVVLLALAALVLANLDLVRSPTRFNLLFTTITAPLGLAVLAIAGTILVVDLIAHQMSAVAWRRDQRQLAEQLERMRRRADDAEEARIGDLRRIVQQEMSGLRGQLDRVLDALEAPNSLPPARRLPRQRSEYPADETAAAVTDNRGPAA